MIMGARHHNGGVMGYGVSLTLHRQELSCTIMNRRVSLCRTCVGAVRQAGKCIY
jgi:hypothetical protein